MNKKIGNLTVVDWSGGLGYTCKDITLGVENTFAEYATAGILTNSSPEQINIFTF